MVRRSAQEIHVASCANWDKVQVMQKTELHARNRHRSRYDFKQLTQANPELVNFVAVNEYGDESIDFADPAAVRALNRAILKQFYGISHWDIPADYLCPPIPGRADYIHHAADLLASTNHDEIPRGKEVRVLDIGTGANCVYPLIGQSEYGWSFVGTEVDPKALDSAAKILKANPKVGETTELRLQMNPRKIFANILKADEYFDLVMCNPPFHASLEDAEAGSRRKWKNLGKAPAKRDEPIRNFGGTGGELWCEGGERAFISDMIEESVKVGSQFGWFTSLVSRDTTLPALENALRRAKVAESALIEMSQGQKKSRIVAWTFQTAT